MTCEHCAKSAEAALNALEGVMASASFDGGLARIETEGRVDNHKLLKAIESKGYGATLLSDNGMTIGGHTMTHLNLPNADYKDAAYEIRECKKLIEKNTGKQVRHFSYPNGGNYDYYNNIVMDIVKNAERSFGFTGKKEKGLGKILKKWKNVHHAILGGDNI